MSTRNYTGGSPGGLPENSDKFSLGKSLPGEPTIDEWRRWRDRSARADWFPIRREFLKILPIKHAAVLQVIFNQSQNKTDILRFDDVDSTYAGEWIPLPVSVLLSELRMGQKTQLSVLTDLAVMSFLVIGRFGTPPDRYIRINVVKIERAIDRAEVTNE